MKNKIHFNTSELEKMEKQNAVHLINSLGGFKSAALATHYPFPIVDIEQTRKHASDAVYSARKKQDNRSQ